MRAVSASWSTAIRYTHPVLTRVGSYLAGVELVNTVPFTKGKIQYDDTGTLKRRLTLTVPARTPGYRWDPAGNATHPLNVYGQRLHVMTGIGYPNGATELLDHGWYLIIGWKRQESDGTVEVEATDLAQLIMDDRLQTPGSPPGGATFASEAARLCSGILPVVVDPALTNRAVPASIVYERERDKALDDLAASWPARWYVGDDAAVHMAAPYTAVTATTPPDVTLTDGSVGTVTGRARKAQRGALYNVVVVDGKTPDNGGTPPHAVRSITDPGSPIRATGPYGRVTRFYESDLITDNTQAGATADALLAQYSTAGRSEDATCSPDPAVQLGDVAKLFTRDGDTFIGRVDAIDIGLTPADAPMTVGMTMTPGTPTARGGVVA